MRLVKILTLTTLCFTALLSYSAHATSQVCTLEVKSCPDGSYVGRSGPNCTFKACPIYTPHKPVRRPPPAPYVRPPYRPPHFRPPMRACTRDLRVCPGGGTVSRNPSLQCNFNPCPRPPHRPYRPHRPYKRMH